jgi:hypothetical protein
MIRAVRPTDVAALRALLRRTGAAELTTHNWPKVQPESGHLPLVGLLTQALSQRADRGGTLVATSTTGLVGCCSARARCDGQIWDVEHLHVSTPEAAVDLLEHVSGLAVEAGARRIFLEVPAESSAVDLARRAGFARYASSTLLQIEPRFRVDSNGAFSARPRLAADEPALFQLYKAAVPAKVRAAEAMTSEEWSALHRGKRRWSPSLFGDRHQFIWDLGAGPIGWLEVVYGQKSQYLEMLVHPQYESMLDRLLAFALTQVSAKARVYASARDYQAGLETTLQRAGFSPVAEADILVRQLAARAPQPRLVPAQLVGS